MTNFLIGLANVMMVLTSLFLICLVLIQRGKGGGLAGAFGGVGGSSAFGTKAGDVFTRVTIYAAALWFTLAMILVYTSNTSDQVVQGGAFAEGGIDNSIEAPAPASGTTDEEKAIANPGSGTPPAIPKPADAATPAPAEPLNPAEAGMRPTSDLPPALPVEPEPSPKS